MTHSAPQDKINLDISLSFLKDFKWVRVEKVNDDKILRLMMPITGSYEGISTDNTCKTTLALKSFMGNSLETTKSAEDELNLFKAKVSEIIESLKILDANNKQINTLEGYLGNADRLLHDFSQFKLSNPNLTSLTEIPVKIQEFIFAEKKLNQTEADKDKIGRIGHSNFYAVHLCPRVPDPILGIEDPVAGTDNAKEDYLKADFRFNRFKDHGSVNDVNYWQIQPDGFVKKLMQEFIGDGAHNQRLAVAKKTKEISAGELNNQFDALMMQVDENRNLNPIFENSSGQQSDDLIKLSGLYSGDIDIKKIFGIDLEDEKRFNSQKENLVSLSNALKEFFKQKFGIPKGVFDIGRLKSVISVNKDNIADISQLVGFVFNDFQALYQGQDNEVNISPFFSINIESTDENNDGRNKLAIISQFFIAKFNQFCVMNGHCDANLDLGTFLDKSSSASEELVKIIKTNLQAGSDEIEDGIIEFLSSLKYLDDNNLISKALSSADSQKLKAEFKLNWQTVQGSDHFDDFMFVSPKDNGRIIHDKDSGNMLFDFSSFYVFQYGAEEARYKPQSYCLSRVANDKEDQERFKDDYYVTVAKQGLIDRIKELLKLPNKDNISEVIVYLLQKTTGVDRNHSFLFKTQGFELESLIPDSADKEQIKKFLKLIAKKNLKDQVLKDQVLKDFLKYIDPNHQEELKFTQQDLRALYVAISARDYGKKNLTVNDIKGYQTPKDIAKIINIALAIKSQEDNYKNLNKDNDIEDFEGIKLDNSLRKIDLTKISVDNAGNAYLAITKEESDQFKTQLDPLKEKFKKIFYLFSGQDVPDQDDLVKKLFGKAIKKLSGSEIDDFDDLEKLKTYYREIREIAVNNSNINQYKVRRALEILGVDHFGTIRRVYLAGSFGYRVELDEVAYLSLERELFSKKITSQQAVKIYQLVRYLCPEETYNEMMRLNNLRWRDPEKFKFALQALGVNFSQLHSLIKGGFEAVIDEDFLGFVDQIPPLEQILLSVDNSKTVYKAFNKRFAGNQQILSQLNGLSNYPNPDKIKFALDKLGIPYYDAKSREDANGIDIEIIPGLVEDLNSYLDSSNASELELQCYKNHIKSSNFSSKILGLDERVLLGELNLARLNLNTETPSPIKFEPPKPQIKIQKVRAYRKTASQSAVVDGNQAKVICPESVLTEFRELMSQTQVLGTEILDPYSQKTIKIPEKPQDLQPWHLQLLARNENKNVTGRFDFSLYQGLMTDDQVVRLRCLVKATTLVGIDKVAKTGGYPNGYPTTIDGGAKKIIVIDQSGLQWQSDHRNTGGMFFYPTDDSNNTQSISGGYESFKKFQKDMYQAMYGRVRDENAPIKQEDYIETNWLGVGGKLDLRGVSLGIKEEFLQALNSAISSSDFVDENEKILFRFLKAGMGFFRDGLKEINGNNSLSGQNSLKLENARIQGILDALKELDKVLPQDLELRKKFFKKVSALQLPFSGNETSPSLNPSQQGLELELAKEVSLLSEIKNLATKLGIEYKGDNKIDACQPENGYVVATTNTGDPHALMGNEGGYQSVDAAISSNLVNPAKFQHLSDNFRQHDRNILVQRSGQKSQSQRVAIVGEVPAMPAPAALSSVAPQQPQVLTPVLEFHGIEYTSDKYNYRPNLSEDSDYEKLGQKIIRALEESYNKALENCGKQGLDLQVKEKLLIAIMQIADKNQGIGNCNPQDIKKQIKDLIDIGDDDTGRLETYYKIAVNFSANFQRQAIAKTGNTSTTAKLETNLRLFRVCTQQNIQDVCLELYDKDNKPAEPAGAGADADLNQERIKKHNRNKKIISLVSNLQKNSDKLEAIPRSNAAPISRSPLAGKGVIR